MVAGDPGRAGASVISAAQSLIGPLSCIVVNRVGANRAEPPSAEAGGAVSARGGWEPRMGGIALTAGSGFRSRHCPARMVTGLRDNVVPVSGKVGSPRRSARPCICAFRRRGCGSPIFQRGGLREVHRLEGAASPWPPSIARNVQDRRWRGVIAVVGALREPVVDGPKVGIWRRRSPVEPVIWRGSRASCQDCVIGPCVIEGNPALL